MQTILLNGIKVKKGHYIEVENFSDCSLNLVKKWSIKTMFDFILHHHLSWLNGCSICEEVRQLGLLHIFDILVKHIRIIKKNCLRPTNWTSELAGHHTIAVEESSSRYAEGNIVTFRIHFRYDACPSDVVSLWLQPSTTSVQWADIVQPFRISSPFSLKSLNMWQVKKEINYSISASFHFRLWVDGAVTNLIFRLLVQASSLETFYIYRQ